MNDPAWVDEAVREIAGLIALAEGRTFVLFTSHRQMQEVHRRLGPRLPYQVAECARRSARFVAGITREGSQL